MLVAAGIHGAEEESRQRETGQSIQEDLLHAGVGEKAERVLDE